MMKALSCVVGMVLCLTPCSLGGEAPAARPERRIVQKQLRKVALDAAADVERLKGTLLEARNVVFEED